MFLNKKLNILIIFTIFTLLITLNEAAEKKQDPKCLLPMETGPCRMSLNRFYYNSQTDTCEEFKFGGCKGNDNKFGFRETCEAACKKSKTPVTTKSPTPTESSPLINKQLKGSTMKSLSTGAAETTSTTTRRPGLSARTTSKTRATTQRSGSTTSTTTPKSKSF